MASSFSSKFNEIEEAIDSAVADTVQMLLSDFRSERERLGLLLQSNDYLFRPNPEFSSLVKKLLATSLGTVSLASNLPPNDPEEKKGILLTQDESSEKSEEKCRSARRGRKRVTRTAYEDMQIVGTVEGKTNMNEPLVKPISIASLTDERAFVVKHNDRLTVLSPSAKMKQTYLIQTKKVKNLPAWTYSSLVQNPFNDQLVHTDRGLLKVIEPIKLPKRAPYCVDSPEISLGVCGVPSGLAMSQSHQQCFTMIRDKMCAFSLANNSWALQGRFPIDDIRNGVALTLRSDGKEIFIKGNDCKSLIGIPMDENGALLPDNLRVANDSFGLLKAAVTDKDGNLIAADRNRCRLVILTPDGEETLARITAHISSSRAIIFAPSDVALLVAPENGELFLFSKGEISCSRVIASPDFSANQIVFFGSVEDST